MANGVSGTKGGNGGSARTAPTAQVANQQTAPTPTITATPAITGQALVNKLNASNTTTETKKAIRMLKYYEDSGSVLNDEAALAKSINKTLKAADTPQGVIVTGTLLKAENRKSVLKLLGNKYEFFEESETQPGNFWTMGLPKITKTWRLRKKQS